MTIVKYKVVASRPFNSLENKGVTETREEVLLSLETPEKRKQLIEWLVDTLDAQDASVPQSVLNAKGVAGLLEQLTQVKANRAVLARHSEVIPCLVRALDSETTIWPAALALDNLNQLGVLKNKLDVVLYLLSNTSALNTGTPSERHQQLRQSLLSTTRGPIYTDAFKTAMETYLLSLAVSVDPNSSAAEVEFFTKVEFFTNRADEVMVFAEAVIPKSMVSLYAFEREKGVYFLRSIRGLHIMLSGMPDTMLSMPDTMFSEMPDSDRKTTLMERKKNLMERQKNLMERQKNLMTQLGWNREFRDLDKHLPNPKILKDYEAELFQKLGRPDLGEVPHDHQYLNPTFPIGTLSSQELETRSLSEPALGTIYNDRQYLYPTFPIVTLPSQELEIRSLSEPVLGEVYDDRGTNSAFL